MVRDRARKSKNSRAGKLIRWVFSHKIPIGTVLALLGAYAGYVNTGADSLRSDIYQPLYREIDAMELCLQANNLEQGYSSNTLDALTSNGNLLRIPKSLRTQITTLYQEAGQAHSHILPIAHKISVMMPQEVRRIRTETDHKTWIDNTLSQLNAASDLNTGSFPLMSFTFNHAARSPALDNRDPKHPRIGNPGIVSWQVNDWMKFPQSASDLVKSWPSTWSLGFDERDESWYYLITRDDLSRNNMSLEQFLKPVYEKLSGDPDFQEMLKSDRTALDMLNQVKQQIAERVEQPKHLIDLFDFL
jgi:hypothetical protein